MEVLDLLLLKPSDGVSVHPYQLLRIGTEPGNPRTGDKVRIRSKADAVEMVPTPFHYAAVVGIHIPDKEPGAEAIARHRHALLRKKRFVGVEDIGRLGL